MRNLLIVGILLLPLFNYAQTPASDIELSRLTIENENRQTSQIDPNSNQDLPLGIGSEIGGNQYIIAIDSLVLSPQGSYMRASASIEIPATGDRIAFSGNHIAIKPGGIASGGYARLELAQDVPVVLSNKVKLTVKSTNRKTFVEFDCHGLQGIGLEGEFEFCRDILIPELPNGEIAPEPMRVKASFETYVNDLSNVTARVSITPFQIPGLTGFGFYVQDAWVDQSDVANPLGLVFPVGYHSPDLDPSSPELWRGFFIRQVDVRLPEQFNAKANNSRRTIKGYNLIIDNMGFTGTIAATNVFPMNDGQAGGWAFSMDSIKIDMACNTLTGAGFRGGMIIPITKEDMALNYTAIIQANDRYLFSVKPRDTLEVPLWKANMNLYPSSMVTMEYVNHALIPTANLNGNINFSASLDSSGNQTNFRGILFENLRVSGATPHLSVGSFSIASSNSNMMGFAVTISNIGFVSAGNQAGVRFDLAVNLMKDKESGFSGKTNLTIWAEESQDETGHHRWRYNRIDLNTISIDVKGGVYEIKGSLTVYRKDPVYGSGFKGTVKAKFQPGIRVDATAQFGNVHDMRYWYVDAFLGFPSGLPVSPGFGIYGFGGGIYHHMKQGNPNAVTLASAPLTAPSSPETASTVVNTSAITLVPNPPSGITYIPDSATFLGLKAKISMGTYPSSEAFNADATFEIAFNDQGGVNTVMVYGSGYFMQPISKRDGNAPVRADVSVSMDFVNHVLHGTLDVYLNVAGVVRGTNANNLAGSAVMHFEDTKWYIYVGTPSQRLGVEFAGLARANAYFMVGTEIPGMPPPPRQVSDILGTDLNFMRDENALGNGSGFAFGSEIAVNTGRKNFLIFFGEFAAGAGFDIMLKNYGPDVTCVGRSEPLGVNGWYASGQAYAYIQGAIGISVDLSFVRGEFKILDVAAAVVLQAKLPNPTWMQGTVGGSYAILGGKIKGNCRFKVTIGEECEIAGGSAVSGIKVIGETSPIVGEPASVFVNPQVTFNINIDKVFELEDLDGNVKSYRARLGYFRLKDGSKEISGTVQWNDNQDVAAFASSDILPPQKEITAEVRVYFEVKVNGVWQPVMTTDHKEAEELKSFTFNTGDAPDNIPASNVAYSYPQVGQYNFIKGEYSTGYITLIKGQPYLFEASTEWNRIARFTEAGGQNVLSSELTYNSGEKTVYYSIPSALQKDQVFSLQLMNVPAEMASAVDANTTASTQNLAGDGDMASLQTTHIEGDLNTLQEKELFGLSFRTSKYNTFSEKMNALSVSTGWSLPLPGYLGLHEIGATVTGEELFDLYDISGNGNNTRMYHFEASLDNSWYKKNVYPLIYQEYPVNGSASITWRNTSDLGLQPTKAIIIREEPSNTIVQPNATTVSPLSGNAAFVYQLPYYMYRDYLDLQQQCAAIYVRNPSGVSNATYNIIFTPFPPVKSGRYDVNLSYALPGTNRVTSIYRVTIQNP